MKKLICLIITLSIMIVLIYYSKKSNKVIPNREPFSQLIPKEKFVNPPKKEKTIEEIVQEVKEEDVRKHMNYLCSYELEGRMSGKKGNRLAGKYIEEEFKKYGLKTEKQKFYIQRNNPGPKNEQGDDYCENIIGWIDGNIIKEEIMVNGAHMDHLGYGPRGSSAPEQGLKIHPGADDNASGTTGLLEIAKAYGKLKNKNKRTIVFIAFSGEEMGLIGSKYYCNNPKFPINKHYFMLNMDMIGYLNKTRTTVKDETLVPKLNEIVLDLRRKYPFSRDITGSNTGGSDHSSFANKGIPVCILHTGQHKQYHTPQDSVEKINFPGMTDVIKYAIELSWKIQGN